LIALLGDVGKVETRLGPFGDSVNLDKIGARFVPNVPRAKKSLWAHPVVLLGNICQVVACFHMLGDSVSLGVR
jgi:hypothetical protein